MSKLKLLAKAVGRRLVALVRDEPVRIRAAVGGVLAFLVSSQVIDVGLSDTIGGLVGAALAAIAFLTTRGKVEPLALQERRLLEAADLPPDGAGVG